MTGHNLSLRDASPPIADAPPSHVHAGRGGVRATSNKHHAPTQTEQRQPGRVRQRPESPTANRSPSPSPRIHKHRRPLRRCARAEFMREACEIRRRTRKVGKPTQKSPPAKRDAQECETLQKVPRRRGAARKDKLLESPNFLCELALFHLAAGQPCVMRWQNSETALRPLHARSWSDPEKGRGGRRTGREGMVSDVIRRAWQACRRTALAAVLTAIALPLACPPSRAAYPERVITLIVPFPVGGPTDIIARIVSLALQKSLGQSVIVDNRGGGEI